MDNTENRNECPAENGRAFSFNLPYRHNDNFYKNKTTNFANTKLFSIFAVTNRTKLCLKSSGTNHITE